MESSPMRYVAAACALGFVWLTTAGAAEIYCNAQGRDCRDRPSGSANIARNAAAQPAISSSSGASDASNGDPVAAQRQQDAAQTRAQEAVEKDLASKRSEQCKKAQENYQRSLEANTMYTTEKDGTKRLLSEAEANQYRLNARTTIEQTCKTGG